MLILEFTLLQSQNPITYDKSMYCVLVWYGNVQFECSIYRNICMEEVFNDKVHQYKMCHCLILVINKCVFCYLCFLQALGGH